MPSLDQLELMDLTAENGRSDIVPVYRKAPLSEPDFRKEVLSHICKIPTLPFDFTTKMTITASGVVEGLFGSLKNEYTVYWKIQKGDYKLQTQNRNANFVLYDNIYTMYGDLPEQLLEGIDKLSDRYFMEKGVRKVGYIPMNKAGFLSQDVLRVRSSPESAKEILLIKLKDWKQYENNWHYSENSAQVTRVVGDREPSYVILAFNYLEWEYEGRRGSIYYNPSSGTVIAPDLPVDEELEQQLKAAKKNDNTMMTIYTVFSFLLLIVLIILGIKTSMKWYMCIVWLFAIGLPVTIVLVILGFSEDRVKSKWEKRRIEANKVL